MKKSIFFWGLLSIIMLVSCSMPVSVEEDNTLSIGQKNAKLVQDKVDRIGANLNSIHVYFGESLDKIMVEFRFDGVYLIDKKGDGYYNLSEMVAMTVEDVTYSQQTKVIKIIF